MKLRIQQDHHSFIQPWYRLEQFVTEPVTDGGTERTRFSLAKWTLVESGKDLEYLRKRMYSLLKPPPGPQFTVIEERET